MSVRRRDVELKSKIDSTFFAEWKASWTLRHRRREMIAGYLFLLPALLLFCIFTFLPMIESFFISFTDMSLNSASTHWVGLQNYALILHSADFWESFLNTAVFAIQVLPLNIIISLFLALLVHKKFKGVGFFRTIFYTPVITSMVAVSVAWLWLFNPSYGLLNSILADLHLPQQSWLVQPHWSLEVLVLLRVWKGVGSNMIIFLAGLNSVPTEMLEAAETDGAGRFRRFWSITWPMLGPTTLYVIVLGTISLLQAFTEVYVMTQGGPLETSSTVVYLLFQKTFQAFQLGFGSAIAFVLFVVILALSMINLVFVQKRLNRAY
ncbi:carbohydrate ABC transporter permease [Alicyclobacillus fodiniaquatilis]|jgi:ABC-type sugar transport system permease subunit|uniref:Carbohydrate ABC transporter permease n=1 Tax=Alicyclobacillus fodiniaquatilis TaxID=1661150 RepID=A0ABW4JEN0_9BACL